MLDLRNEKERAERGKHELEFRAVSSVDRRDRSGVADVAAAVDGGIGVEDLAPPAAARHLEAVVPPHRGGEIGRDDAQPVRVLRLAQPHGYAAFGVIANDPLEDVILT